MSKDPLNYDDLVRIVELIKSSEQFSEFRLKIGDVEIELRRRNPPGASAPVAAAPAPAQPATPASAPASRPAPSRHVPSSLPDGSIVIRSPMVGTFYRAPEPGAKPFVEVGQAVDDHTIVCIIEVMKLMNSIAAGARGTVTHILVDDATPVETGAPLIVLQPELPPP